MVGENTTRLPTISLLVAAAHNHHRERSDIRLFEIGAAFTRQGEARRAGIAWTGDANAEHWSTARRPVDFFDLKGLVERIADALQADLTFDAAAIPSYLVRGRAAGISSGTRPLGAVGMLLSSIAALLAHGAVRSSPGPSTGLRDAN